MADICAKALRLARAFHKQYEFCFEGGNTDDTEAIEDRFAKQLTAIFREYTDRPVGWSLGGDYRYNIVRVVVPSGKESWMGCGGIVVPYAAGG